jgi:large conductance mechanosensitive channel
LDFLIVAFAIFLLIRQINRMTRAPEAAPVAPSTKTCPHCYSGIHLEATRCAYCTSVV